MEVDVGAQEFKIWSNLQFLAPTRIYNSPINIKFEAFDPADVTR